MRFADRVDAGQRLADRLSRSRLPDPVVLALPRGGVPVGYRVARALGAPLDVLVIRKLGVPFQPELGFGAIGEGGASVINEEVVRMARLGELQQAEVAAHERGELERRLRRYRGDRPPVPLAGRTAVVVDDGVATGSTARIGCRLARERGAARVVLAVPVGPTDTLSDLAAEADDVVCLSPQAAFGSVGEWYDDFAQTTDAEVGELLERAAGEADTAGGPDPEVEVTAGPLRLPGSLALPDGAAEVVAFAHGSGSSRFSPRNRQVARALNAAGLGTLLFDLLTPGEEMDRNRVFDIPILAGRLVRATQWLRRETGLPVAYFGASTGAAAALAAAAEPASEAVAVVSRGGRPDLAADALEAVRAPTLLIVGGEDTAVLGLNRQAAARLSCAHELSVIPGATHLFEEPGALEQVSALARDWFTAHPPAADRGLAAA